MCDVDQQQISLSGFIDQTLEACAAGDELPCQVNDPEMWFAQRPADVEFAKALCGTCPLQQQCLAGALEREEPWGVWGGQIFEHGVVIARKRPRGRPRKNPVAA